jgi:hypothetical protein
VMKISDTPITNIAPNITSVRISPATPTQLNNIIGYCTAEDAELDNVSYYWQWYENGVLQTSGSILNLTSGTEAQGGTVLGTSTISGQSWTFGCYASDTSLNSSQTNTSFFITSTVPGGGSGYTSSVIDFELDLCDIRELPPEIIIDDTHLTILNTIVNREYFKITPRFFFTDVVGKASILDRLEFETTPPTVGIREREQFYVNYVPGPLGAIEAEGGAEMLIVFSEECQDIVIPITMNVTDNVIMSEVAEYLLLADNTNQTLAVRVTEVLKEPVFRNAGWSKVWVFIGLIAVFLGALLWNAQIVEDSFSNGITKFILWIIGTGILTMVVVALMRGIG